MGRGNDEGDDNVKNVNEDDDNDECLWQRSANVQLSWQDFLYFVLVP